MITMIEVEASQNRPQSRPQHAENLGFWPRHLPYSFKYTLHCRLKKQNLQEALKGLEGFMGFEKFLEPEVFYELIK